MKTAVSSVLAIVLSVLALSASAEASKAPPLTLVVPFTQGGPTDALARPLASAMSRALNRHVVVKNIVGAGGTVGEREVARAKADGSTLLFTNVSHAVAPLFYPKLKYDPAADFEPVGLVADVPMVLVGRKGLKADNLAALLSKPKIQARKPVYGHAGVGSASYLCGTLIMKAAKHEFTPRAYAGSAEAMADLVTEGNIDLLCDQATAALDDIGRGTVKAYAVTGPSRLTKLPGVPTFGEAGIVDMDFSVMHGVFAPKGTPPQVLEALATAVRTALQDTQVRESFAAMGAQVAERDAISAAALKKRIEGERNRWERLVGAKRN